MSKTIKLSVVLATYNEEENIGLCLESIKEIADEVIIVDGSSQDKTVEIAKSFGAKILVTDNPPIFHINKQKALKLARGEWILQLDADERVTKELAREIIHVTGLNNQLIDAYQETLQDRRLFLRHQRLLEQRDGSIGRDGVEYAAFFIPRLNYFLGKFLRYGGVYPDGVIRLIKKDKAFFPCKSVHEQIAVLGRVGWLQNPLLHMADLKFSRYVMRNNRYINLIAKELERDQVKKGVWQSVDYILIKPVWWFLLTLIRHKGILDGFPGIVFSFFSALRFPRAYLSYLMKK